VDAGGQWDRPKESQIGRGCEERRSGGKTRGGGSGMSRRWQWRPRHMGASTSSGDSSGDGGIHRQRRRFGGVGEAAAEGGDGGGRGRRRWGRRRREDAAAAGGRVGEEADAQEDEGGRGAAARFSGVDGGDKIERQESLRGRARGSTRGRVEPRAGEATVVDGFTYRVFSPLHSF
jgi:hypothetical protein